MKKLVLVSTVAALALGVAACGKKDDAAVAGNDVSVLNAESGDTNLTATDGTLPPDNAEVANALDANAADTTLNAAN